MMSSRESTGQSEALDLTGLDGAISGRFAADAIWTGRYRQASSNRRSSGLFAIRESLSGSYPATPEIIGTLRQELADYAATAGLTGQALDAVRLAVSEAVTNVVRHAYGGKAGQVHVTAGVAGNELWILIADDGRGFNTPSSDPGLGMGLALITNACDEFALAERAEGGTEARMRFLLRPELRTADQ